GITITGDRPWVILRSMPTDGASSAPKIARRMGRRAFGGMIAATLALIAAHPGRVAGQEASARTFEITASRFKFEPAVIEVREGDEVRLNLHSADTTHGLEIKELKV